LKDSRLKEFNKLLSKSLKRIEMKPGIKKHYAQLPHIHAPIIIPKKMEVESKPIHRSVIRKCTEPP
jgi:hypothetical protein